MNDELFAKLLDSTREGGALLRGEKEPSRLFLIEPPRQPESPETSRTRSETMSVQHFHNDDAGFLQWMSEHPKGVVLNVKNDSTLTLHKSLGCSHIASHKSSNGLNPLTQNPKACSSDEDSLLNWAKENRPSAAGSIKHCRSCKW